MNLALVRVFKDVIQDKSLLSEKDKKRLLNILLEDLYSMDIEYFERIKDLELMRILNKEENEEGKE